MYPIMENKESGCSRLSIALDFLGELGKKLLHFSGLSVFQSDVLRFDLNSFSKYSTLVEASLFSKKKILSLAEEIVLNTNSKSKGDFTGDHIKNQQNQYKFK